VPTFPDRGCHVVSVTDPYNRILGFLDRWENQKETENQEDLNVEGRIILKYNLDN
jgi:hypothetical protein